VVLAQDLDLFGADFLAFHGGSSVSLGDVAG
jgi:hypothetical protein